MQHLAPVLLFTSTDLLQNDCMAVELAGSVCSVLDSSWHSVAKACQLSCLAQQLHETLAVVHFQMSIGDVQLH